MKQVLRMFAVLAVGVLILTAYLGAKSVAETVGADSELPSVLLIGDSIRGGYMYTVSNVLSGKVEVDWPSINCGGTDRGLVYIDDWLAEGTWDVIHFNWGLWDINRRVDGGRNTAGPLAETEESYESQLEQLVERLEETDSILIWASTTFVQGGWGRRCGDDVRYNEIAKEIMDRHGIPINDLHALSASFPLYGEGDPDEPEMWRSVGNVHFSDAGSERLGEQVAASITNILATAGGE